jgi:3-dehydrotetronate 4-kinase
MLLGCIGDDFTGSSDLGATLAREGLHTVQYSGVPAGDAAAEVEAGIVALKSRTCLPAQAVTESLAALDWLRRQGCRQFFFKYCSTFDSTPQGNIGPVIDALLEALSADRAVVCPAFPGAGRRVYQGHLFVNDKLLNESGMQDHPLTPMTDPDIRRWLAHQSARPVGHVAHQDVAQGPEAIAAAIDREVAAGRPAVVVDAISDRDLRNIGRACAGLPLVTGGSGVALGLPANFTERRPSAAADWQGLGGPGVVLSGSCSLATRGQVAAYAIHHPALAVDPQQVMDGTQTAASVAAWLSAHLDETPMAYSTADPKAVSATQSALGREAVAAAIEGLFAEVAQTLAAAGVQRFIVAGGETSGAVTAALGVESLRIGPEIAPGVPALAATDREVVLALKSGNFGAPDFFEKAAAILEGAA